MDIINQYLSDNYIVGMDEIIDGKRFFHLSSRPRVVCKDGFSISIQASENHYCDPRESFKPRDGKTYSAVELGYPSAVDDLITFYAEDDEYTETVYGYVPIDVVVQLIEKHGGIDGTVRKEKNAEPDDSKSSKDCFCRDDVADIISEKIDFMGEPVATLNVFITDNVELELFMDADYSDAVLIKKKVPIHFCPFCGRFLYKKEDDNG